jgi:AraC-like DNA-binding protein
VATRSEQDRPSRDERISVHAINVGCGTLEPVRSSALASMYEYEYGRQCAPAAVQDKHFELDVIVATTHGHWEFHGKTGPADIDGSSLMVGAAGDSYGCRHDPRSGDGNLAVCLLPGAIDPDVPLFGKQIVPSAGALRLLHRASHAETDDEFDSIVFTLFNEASMNSRDGTRPEAQTLRMQRAKRFIELHAFEQLRLADLARELGLSPFTTLRQFRAATGKTPHGYLLELRLAEAKRLLKKTTGSVESIAKNLGFDDLAYFSRFFKQRTGYSPSSYRAA